MGPVAPEGPGEDGRFEASPGLSGLILLAVTLASPWPTAAQPTAHLQVVVVDSPRLEASVGELLGGRFSLEVEPRAALVLEEILTPAQEPSLARAFLAPTFAGGPLLVVADDTRARVYVRRLPASDDAELVRERLLNALEASLESLQAGIAIGTERSEVAAELSELAPNSPAAEPAPLATPSDRPAPVQPSDPAGPGPDAEGDGLRVFATAGYDLALIGDDQWVHGPRLSILASPDGAPWLRAFAEVSYRFADVLRDEALTGRIDMLGARLGVALGSLSPRIEARAGVGIDVNILIITPAAGYSLRADVTVDVYGTVGGRLTIAASPDFGLYLDVGVDLYWLRSQWSRGEELVLAPWPLRPFAGLGIQLF